MEMLLFVPTCTNLYQSVPQYIWYSLVQIGTGWYRLVQVDTNRISYLYQPVPTCINLYHYIAGTGWYRLVQIGTGWYRLVQIETGWYRLVQIGKDLKYFGGMIQIYILLSHTSLL